MDDYHCLTGFPDLAPDPSIPQSVAETSCGSPGEAGLRAVGQRRSTAESHGVLQEVRAHRVPNLGRGGEAGLVSP